MNCCIFSIATCSSHKNWETARISSSNDIGVLSFLCFVFISLSFAFNAIKIPSIYGIGFNLDLELMQRAIFWKVNLIWARSEKKPELHHNSNSTPKSLLNLQISHVTLPPPSLSSNHSPILHCISLSRSAELLVLNWAAFWVFGGKLPRSIFNHKYFFLVSSDDLKSRVAIFSGKHKVFEFFSLFRFDVFILFAGFFLIISNLKNWLTVKSVGDK